MVETYQHFGRRVKLLNRKNALMANGYYTTLRNDGLIVARPIRRHKGFPFKAFFVIAVMFFCFKAFVLSSIGPGAYQIRLSALDNGTMVERAGGWALGLDPMTMAIANKVGPIFRD